MGTLRANARDAALFEQRISGPAITVFVDSATGASGNDGLTPDSPVATVAQALLLCTASRGDRIVLFPGHTETLGASGLAVNVAGVEVIGLGRGSMRPAFTLSTTDAKIAVSVANVRLANFRLTCSIDEVVSAVSVTAANCEIDAVDYFETSTFQLIQFLLTTAAADGITVKNCRHTAATAAGSAQKWIQLVGVDDCLICDNTFNLTLNNAAGSVTISGSTALVRGQIARNRIVQLGGTSQVSAILLVDSSTAMVTDNRCAVGSTALAGICDVGNAGYACENYCLNTADKSGILDPVVDS